MDRHRLVVGDGGRHANEIKIPTLRICLHAADHGSDDIQFHQQWAKARGHASHHKSAAGSYEHKHARQRKADRVKWWWVRG